MSPPVKTLLHFLNPRVNARVRSFIRNRKIWNHKSHSLKINKCIRGCQIWSSLQKNNPLSRGGRKLASSNHKKSGLLNVNHNSFNYKSPFSYLIVFAILKYFCFLFVITNHPSRPLVHKLSPEKIFRGRKF